MTDDTVLDTTIREPSRAPGEVEMLLFALDRSRAQFAWKCGGLDAAALSRRHPPSAMTLGGLVKHMALNEDWTTSLVTGDPMVAPWTSVDFDANPDWEWHSAADDPPEEIYRLWRTAVERSRALLPPFLAAGGLERRWAFDTGVGERPNARRRLVDLHDEYARHVGHADLFREAIDGLVGEDPPQ